jgi:hypothetical protein
MARSLLKVVTNSQTPRISFPYCDGAINTAFEAVCNMLPSADRFSLFNNSGESTVLGNSVKV